MQEKRSGWKVRHLSWWPTRMISDTSMVHDIRGHYYIIFWRRNANHQIVLTNIGLNAADDGQARVLVAWYEAKHASGWN